MFFIAILEERNGGEVRNDGCYRIENPTILVRDYKFQTEARNGLCDTDHGWKCMLKACHVVAQG